MRHFSTWIKTVIIMSELLEQDPGNEQAKKIRNIAGASLINGKYPYKNINGKKILQVGSHTFNVEDMEEDGDDIRSELVGAYSEQMADLQKQVEAAQIALFTIRSYLGECEKTIEQAFENGQLPRGIQVSTYEDVRKQYSSVDGVEEIPDDYVTHKPQTERTDAAGQTTRSNIAVRDSRVDSQRQIPEMQEKSSILDMMMEYNQDTTKQPAEDKPDLPEIIEWPEESKPDTPEIIEQPEEVKPDIPEIIEWPEEEKSDTEQPAEAPEEDEQDTMTEDLQNSGATEELHAPTDPMSGYKDNLRKEDIVFSYHKIKIKKDDSDIVTDVEVIISPLSMEEGQSRVIAWASNGIRHETRKSSETRKSVLLQVSKVPLAVSGRVENGRFIGEVETTKRMQLNGISLEQVSQTYGGTGHIRLCDEGIDVRLVPLTEGNKTNGSASFYYAISIDGEETITGDNSDEDTIRFMYQGKRLELAAKWKNDRLYGVVREA